MKEIWKKAAELDRNQENWLYIVTEGPHIGDKMLLQGGIPFFTEGGFFRNYTNEGGIPAERDFLKKAGSLKGSGVFETNGTRIYAERLGVRNEMVICGGGHVSMPIIQIAKMTGFQVTVLEDRPFFAGNARRAGADTVICDSYEKALSGIEGSDHTWFVIVTRGHRYDEECLAAILRKPAAYVGMMGSRRRVGIVRNNMLEQKCDPERIGQLHAPIGLSIGAETPEEIAVSVMAEIIQIKNERAKGSGEGISEEFLSAVLEERPKVMATIISRKGSAPREVGTRMLIFRDGTILGTVGGGCAEAEVVQAARRMMSCAEGEKPVPGIFQVELIPDTEEEDGMLCGGVQEVFLEPC